MCYFLFFRHDLFSSNSPPLEDEWTPTVFLGEIWACAAFILSVLLSEAVATAEGVWNKKKRCVCQGWAAVGEPAIWQLRGDDGAAALVRPSLPIGIYLQAVEGIRSSNLGAFANKHVSILSLLIEANKPAKPLAKAFPSWASGSAALYWWGGKKYANTQEIMCFIFLAPVKKKEKKHVFGTQKMCVLNRENHIFLKQRRERRNCRRG